LSKKIRFITPAVTLVWPKLNTPDEYKPKKGPAKVRYTTDAKLQPEDLKTLKKWLLGLAKKHLPDVEEPKLPLKTDKKTGELMLTATSGVKYRPPVFAADGETRIPASVEIGGGTKAKLDLTVNFFEISGENSGINLYINAVQVLDLQEGGFKSNFGAEEGFTYKGASDDGEDEDSNNSSSEDEDDESTESPFKF
jgi:hypothetical protein